MDQKVRPPMRPLAFRGVEEFYEEETFLFTT
jgi:hypothetical protein